LTFRPLRTQPRTNSEKRIWEAHPCGFCKGGIFSAFSSFQFLFSSCAREKKRRRRNPESLAQLLDVALIQFALLVQDFGQLASISARRTSSGEASGIE